MKRGLRAELEYLFQVFPFIHFIIGIDGPVAFGSSLSNTLGIMPFTLPRISFITLDLNCSDVTYLYAKYVPPLIEATIMKEMILKTLAAEKRMEPGSTRGGIEVVRNALGSLGVDTTYVVMRDGSGLAGGNFLTTSVISELLFVMSKHHEFDAFESSLPILGEDGTLHYRMKQSPLRGQVFAKTGYVGGARSLSGYLNSQSGEKVIFSLSANNFVGKVSRIDAVHEQILTYLYYHY